MPARADELWGGGDGRCAKGHVLGEAEAAVGGRRVALAHNAVRVWPVLRNLQREAAVAGERGQHPRLARVEDVELAAGGEARIEVGLARCQRVEQHGRARVLRQLAVATRDGARARMAEGGVDGGGDERRRHVERGVVVGRVRDPFGDL